MFSIAFRPKLIDCLRDDYTRSDFFADLSAGVTVGVIALPLAMAFAIASGVSPQAGIYTAIIAGFLISVFGGSRVQIGGPTGAFIVIVYGIVARYGLANLILCTLGAGVILTAMGLLRLGGLIRFIPVSIVIGFTNGIAVLILLSQARDFLGLPGALPDEFFAQLRSLGSGLSASNPYAIGVGVFCLAVLLLWPRKVRSPGEVLEELSLAPAAVRDRQEARFRRGLSAGADLFVRLPGPIVVLLVASVGCTLLSLPVETIGTRFGGIPTGLPVFVLPSIALHDLRDLIAPTITIALLGAIESLLSARVADAMIRDRHDPNQELIAQGIANIVAPFFGGIPATGAIARTAANVRTGARTPIAGVVHALTLLAIVLVAAPLAKYIPLAALSAVLIVVAINMGDWHAFRQLRRYSIPYGVVLLATFCLTVVFNLTVAVEVGLVLASLFFIYRVSESTRIEVIATHDSRIVAYRVFGALFFGSVAKLEPLLESATTAKVVVLDMHQVISLDNTALDTLESVRQALVHHGGVLLLCALNEHPDKQVRRSEFAQLLDMKNVLPTFAAAMERARSLVSTAQ